MMGLYVNLVLSIHDKLETMDRIEIFRTCDEVFNQQIQLVASFDAINVNRIPFEGSWTAGHIVQHTIMSNSLLLELLNGDVIDTGRPVDLVVPDIARDLLDFTAKMKSAESLTPGNRLYEPDGLSSQVQQIYLDIIHVIENLDLTKTCTAFGLPGYGLLTRMEAVYFIICHTERHNRQLKKIIDILSDSTKTNVFGWLVFEFLSHSGDHLFGRDTPVFP